MSIHVPEQHASAVQIAERRCSKSSHEWSRCVHLCDGRRLGWINSYNAAQSARLLMKGECHGSCQ